MTDVWSQRLSEYIDGTLSDSERAELEQHLITCAQCRNEVRQLDSVVAWLKTDTDDDVDAAKFAAIRTAIAPRKSRWPILVPWATAAMLAIIAGSLWLSRPNSPDVAQPPVAQSPYQQAVADLEQVLEQGRGKLDPATQRKLENSIALIDQAIRQSEQALAADTSNEFVSRHIAKLREAKLTALRDAATVVRAKL